MFSLALLTGIFSYFILFLGLSNILFKETIIGGFLLILLSVVITKRSLIKSFLRKGLRFRIKLSALEWVLIAFITIQALVNLVGILSPEIAFDALWYHLTLPKLYLLNNSIYFVPGGLLYYSVMPKLVDMLYVFGLSLGSDLFPRLIHYLFGLLTVVVSYKLSRIFLDKKYSLISSVIFYSSIVVGWESVSSYIDLGRAFFEVLTLWGFINWIKTGEKKWLIESAIILGLAISTKILAIQSLIIFMPLIIYAAFVKKQSIRDTFKNVLMYTVVSLSISIPWLVFSFMNTGNPIYPFFNSNIYVVGDFLNINIESLWSNLLALFYFFTNQISPIYLIIFPLTFAFYKKFTKELRVVYLYSALALVVLYIFPKDGQERFILAYLPAFSIICSATISKIKTISIKNYLIYLVLFLSLFSITYRGAANARYLSVIFNDESSTSYLEKKLNFNFGDFYDTDGFFKENIKKDDMVLLYGFHNLYYVDFPFTHESWIKKGDSFSYIATQNTDLPRRFKGWRLVYENKKTNVKLYNINGLTWHY